jgi:hypothetical protein
MTEAEQKAFVAGYSEGIKTTFPLLIYLLTPIVGYRQTAEIITKLENIGTKNPPVGAG